MLVIKLPRQSYLPKLIRKNAGKRVELAIKYVWHTLFDFACDFLVHQ